MSNKPLNINEKYSITDKISLENYYDPPLEIAKSIMLNSLDKYHILYIKKSPFICIATTDADGQPTISPKGDKPGFTEIIDNNTLIIPDRIGNNKLESLHNLVENPKIGLIFMVPGAKETLRISGTAQITTDKKLLKFGQIGGKTVKAGLIVHITKCYFHCGKAIIRSKLWNEESKISKGTLPSFGKIINEQAKLQESVKSSDDLVTHVYKNELY
ncbi:MAG: pyridoxamine 5'-phosphate oxidase [Rhodospirillaceae bacterium]|nr:pyridoxamine 5'-phosphate oxidase [Rhodospirillaceae bacterium]